MICAVIFDKDGTLHDTEKVYHRAWREAAAQMGVPRIMEFVALCTGTNYARTAELWQEFYGDAFEFRPFWELRNAIYDEMIETEGLPIKDGAYELLEYLCANGYKIGLATSTNAPRVERHLVQSDMKKYFDAVVTGDAVQKGKPAPDIFLIAAERLGVAPADCMGVEDSFNGVRAVKAAGMYTVMAPDMIQPTKDILDLTDACVQSLGQIIPILENMKGRRES
ncbi:MAG: HAD family phosphatase [Clostridia bacterium]|nr:HAD family phosphatase [Clostridia bacterium]